MNLLGFAVGNGSGFEISLRLTEPESWGLPNSHTVTSDCNRVMVNRVVILFTAMHGPQPSARAAADPRTVRLALELLERTAGRCRRCRSVIAGSTRVPLRLERASILAINALAQPLARLEIRRVPGRKRHRRPGPGVAGDPRGAESDREAAEAPDLDSPATGETCRHLLEHQPHRERDVTLDELGLLLRKSGGSAPTSSSAHCPIPVCCRAALLAVDGQVAAPGRCRRGGHRPLSWASETATMCLMPVSRALGKYCPGVWAVDAPHISYR